MRRKLDFMKNSIHHTLIQLKPSSPITVEIITATGQRLGVRSFYIGYLADQYIFLHKPDCRKSPEVDHYLVPQTACTIRALSEEGRGAVLAFVTTIVKVIDIPTKMLVCTVPSNIASQPLRKDIRIPTSIPAKIKSASAMCDVMILDLSQHGCRVLIEKEHPVDLSIKKIQLRTIETQDQASLTLECEVCSVKRQGKFEIVGLQFNDTLSKEVELLIKQLIFNQ